MLRILPILLLLVSLSVMPAQAQTHRRDRPSRPTSGQLVKAYTDSLTHLSDSLYSARNHAATSSMASAQLFLPLTFYRGIAHDAFSLDTDLSDIDRQLLPLYLLHPELVQNTQSRLENIGSVLPSETVTDHSVDIIDRPTPQEPQRVPVDIMVLKPNFWHFGGEYYLQFLQNYLTDNWYQGGESNYSMVGSVTLDANYNNKQKVKWENRLELKYGMQTTKGDSVHKARATEDLIRLTSKLGVQSVKQWYYTVQLVAQTQWARHYNANNPVTQSDFFSPFNLNLSIGMDYNVKWLHERLTGSIHLAPLAYNFKYSDRLSLASSFGIKADHHALNDIGSQVTVDLLWKFADNLSWKTRFYYYTTYRRAELEWENTFSFQFNRWISAKVFLYPRFDDARSRDDKLGYWMFKEFISLGFSYTM